MNILVWIMKRLRVLKTAVANKWLHETTETVGDIKRHAECGDSSTH